MTENPPKSGNCRMPVERQRVDDWLLFHMLMWRKMDKSCINNLDINLTLVSWDRMGVRLHNWHWQVLSVCLKMSLVNTTNRNLSDLNTTFHFLIYYLILSILMKPYYHFLGCVWVQCLILCISVHWYLALRCRRMGYYLFSGVFLHLDVFLILL